MKLVEKEYKIGVKLNKIEMAEVEKRIIRLEGLENWFVKIPYKGYALQVNSE